MMVNMVGRAGRCSSGKRASDSSTRVGETVKHRITLIPGDGIGPEVTGAVVKILDSAGLDVEWESHPAGVLALDAYGTPLPERAARLDQAQQGRAQGAGDDAGRRRVHQRERRPAQGARPVRQPAAGLEHPVGAVALRGRRPRHRAREHRGPLLRPRARGRARRRREPEDHHRATPRRASRGSPSSTRASTGASASPRCTRPTS